MNSEYGMCILESLNAMNLNLYKKNGLGQFPKAERRKIDVKWPWKFILYDYKTKTTKMKGLEGVIWIISVLILFCCKKLLVTEDL